MDATGTITQAKTFIRIGFETTICAEDIVAIMPFDQEHSGEYDMIDPTNIVLDMTQVRGFIKLKEVGGWFAYALSHRELDNRLRKAGHTIL